MGQPAAPDHSRARDKYHRLARTYDRFIAISGRLARLERQRARAIDKLDLQRGDVVIDVGCGTGLSFSLIEQQVGPRGRVIGFELSPDMIRVARERIARHRWANITVVESAVEEASAGVKADGALLCLVHDITRSRPALETSWVSSTPAVASRYWEPGRSPARHFL